MTDRPDDKTRRLSDLATKTAQEDCPACGGAGFDGAGPCPLACHMPDDKTAEPLTPEQLHELRIDACEGTPMGDAIHALLRDYDAMAQARTEQAARIAICEAAVEKWRGEHRVAAARIAELEGERDGYKRQRDHALVCVMEDEAGVESRGRLAAIVGAVDECCGTEPRGEPRHVEDDARRIEAVYDLAKERDEATAKLEAARREAAEATPSLTHALAALLNIRLSDEGGGSDG